MGLVGERRNVRLLYLVFVSRLLDRIVSAVVKGPSSGGKSFTLETVMQFFPLSAFYALSSLSDRALAYSQEPLAHRIMVVFEAAGLTSEFGSYLMRSLLSEGRLRYETVERTDDGLKPKLIEREGPTGLIVTTTWASLHPENETRMLSLVVRDDRQQTAGVLRALADRSNGIGPQNVDFQPWHALQTWLELAGAREVTIPYAHELADLTDPAAVRIRRDFGAVISLIRAHAVLQQLTRARDDRGRIVATLDDYAAVHDLVTDLVSQGVKMSVSKEIRDTVAAVAELATGEKLVSLRQVADHLHIDKSSASRRVRVAIEDGYLVNHEDKKGKPAKLGLGDALPAEKPVLPAPADLAEKISLLYPSCNSATVQQSTVAAPLHGVLHADAGQKAAVEAENAVFAGLEASQEALWADYPRQNGPYDDD
jgi:hypothetical protein